MMFLAALALALIAIALAYFSTRMIKRQVENEYKQKYERG